MTNYYSALDNLPADYESLLGLIRERDQLLLEYVAALSLSDEQYTEWNPNSWKKYARNHLALIQAVRPVTYADYRHRIKMLSPTFGIIGPNRLVTGWMLDSEEQLRREAEAGSAALLALFVEEEQPGELLSLPTAEALPLPALPLFVEPETLLHAFEEPLMSVKEFHAAPAFEGVFLAPTATVEEVERLVQGRFSWNGLGEDNPTLGKLYERRRALLLAPSGASNNAVIVDENADRLAAIELRKRKRAKLQANNAELANALKAPIFNNHPTATAHE